METTNPCTCDDCPVHIDGSGDCTCVEECTCVQCHPVVDDADDSDDEE